MKYFLSIFLFFAALTNLQAQITPDSPQNSAKYIQTIEQSLQLFYQDYAQSSNYDSIITALNYETGTIPEFDDATYCARLAAMNEMSPFQMDCEPEVLATIKFFAAKRRSFVRIVMGRSKLYFDMFEQKLAEYNLPMELKYLAVIESGLRPQVKSRAGALGLWQFMYGTGKMFDLQENSYIDERMDPEKATDAACRYLKKLYEIYGDWNLALASYNAGPGNVNKAIRRSGGKKTYWEVRPFLPRETQGYVPNFIAAAYLMTYHAEHNIIPMDATIHRAELDTMCIKSGLHMSTISKVSGWDIEEIQALNPVYKATYIPKTNPQQCIYGPLAQIGKLVSLEDSLYATEDAIYNPNSNNVPLPENQTVQKEENETILSTNEAGISTVNHKVRSGESLGKIAEIYDVSVSQIMEWNNLKTTVLYVGQLLKVETKKTNVIKDSEVKLPPPVKEPTVAKKYYSVRSGDTFSKIAEKHSMSQTQLKKLNPGINISKLNVGQRIRVK